MSKPIAEVRGVAKSFGTTRALREAHLVLNAGEIHALLGENGAGKSTLVKILVGALQPDAGELRVDDRPLHLVGVAEAVAAGLVPIYQHRTLLPDLSVRENLLAFDLAAGSGWRITPRRNDEQIAQMLAAVGLRLIQTERFHLFLLANSNWSKSREAMLANVASSYWMNQRRH